MDRDYFMDLADRFRSPHIWKWEDNMWKLRHTPYEGDSEVLWGDPSGTHHEILAKRLPAWGKLSAKRTDEGWTFRGNPFAGNRGIRAPHPALLRAATFPHRGRL